MSDRDGLSASSLDALLLASWRSLFCIVSHHSYLGKTTGALTFSHLDNVIYYCSQIKQKIKQNPSLKT